MASYRGVLIVSDVGRLSSPRLAMEVRTRAREVWSSRVKASLRHVKQATGCDSYLVTPMIPVLQYPLAF